MAPKEDQVIDEIFTKQKHRDNDDCEFQQQRSPPPPQRMEVLSFQPPSDQSHVSCPGVASRREPSPSRTHHGSLRKVGVETGPSPELYLLKNATPRLSWVPRLQVGICIPKSDHSYAGLRRPVRRGHPPGTACALPRAWDGGASRKSQLHRAVAGRSRQESVGDARIEDRLVGDRTARLGTAGPARCTAATVAPAAPRPKAKVSAAVAASRESAQEAARVLPAGNHGPLLRFMSFVISRTWQGVVLEKYSRKASCVNEPVRGLLWGLIVEVSFSFQ